MTDPAEILINYLKGVADTEITSAAGAANTAIASGRMISIASDEKIHGYEFDVSGAVTPWTSENPILGYKRPDHVASLTASQIPTLPSLPALTDDLKVDFAKIVVDATAKVNDLKATWMAQFIPAATDVTSLDKLFNNTLNGSDTADAKVKMAALQADTTTALAAITATAMNEVNTAITLSKANLATNFASGKAGIAAALVAASDNTQNIAWATARDQVAREAARQEKEAVSNFAARGFSLPAGVLSKQLGAAQQATLDSASEIAAKQAIAMQQAQLDIAAKTIDAYMRNMEIQANSEMASYKAYVDSRLRYSELELDAKKYNAELAFKHLGLTLDFTKFAAELAVKYRLGVMEAINNLITAYSRLMLDSTTYLKNIADAKIAAQNALTEYFRAAIQYADIKVKTDLQNNANDIQYAQIIASYLSQSIGHSVAGASAGASAFASAASSALSGLNGVASTTISTSA